GGSVEIARLAGDGKREVAGDGQPGYCQRLEAVARAKAVAQRSPVDVEPPMEAADPGDPPSHSEEGATRGTHTDFPILPNRSCMDFDSQKSAIWGVFSPTATYW